MPQAPRALSPFCDWLPLHFQSLLWQISDVFGSPIDVGMAYDADQLDPTASPEFQGLAIPKPTIDVAGDYDEDVTCAFVLPLPDFVVSKQPERLREWSGAVGDDMAPEGGARRIALQMELVLSSRNDTVIGEDLVVFAMAAKFRGCGATLVSPDPGSTGDTQDAPVAPDVTGTTGAIFGDMAAPSIPPNDANVAVAFADDGAARIQCVVEIPSTVAMGDTVEVTISVSAGTRLTAVQYQSLKYRWITEPFPFEPNRVIQLLGQLADDPGADNLDQLESQSRLDGSNDASPYRP